MSAAVAPWLSILVPVYNVQDYLEECLTSVVEQLPQLQQSPNGVAGVEILVLDDRSTDGSRALMDQLAQRWPGRLTLMHHAVNQGLSAARNTMIDAARGEYLWFLDSDDRRQCGAIAALHRIVHVNGPDMVVCDFRLWRERMGFKHRLRGEGHRRSFAGPSRRLLIDQAAFMADLCMPGQMHAWSKISRRTLWHDGLRFPAGRYFEDMATVPRLALRAHSLWYEPAPWVDYRQRRSSILSTLNLNKVADLSSALRVTRQELDALPVLAQDARVCIAMSHLSARNFIGAMRWLDKQKQGELTDRRALAQRFLQDFLASAPLSPQALVKVYGRKGWWLRRARLQACLRQVDGWN